MAKLTTNDVKKVAKLAKLSLSSSEINRFQVQLSEIVSYIDKLGQVNTAHLVPTSQTTGLVNVDRDDKRVDSDCLSQEDAIGGSSKTHNSYFVVDAVLSERSDK